MSHPSPLTILLIDDCADERVAYCRFLQQDSRYTYRILEFETATAAMNWCQQETPDVILLDFSLPDVDGLEFIQQFREQLKNTQSAVIMLTGQGDESIAVRAMKSGAQDYLVKSKLTPEILQSAIHHAVEQVRLLRQLEQSREQQQLIAAIALRIRQSLKLEEILRITAKEVRQFLKADRVMVYQFQPDLSGTVVAESVLPGWTVSLGVEIPDTWFQQGGGAEYYQGKKRAIDDIYQAGLTDCHLQLLEQFEVKANLVVPILVTDSLWGLLIAHQCSRSRHWEATDLELLDQLGVQLSLAIQQANAYHQLQVELAERRWIEAALQASEEKLKLTLDFAHIGYWERNFITNELFASDNAIRCFGYERNSGKVTTQEWLSLIHPEDREWVQQKLRQAIATKTDYAVEYRVVWPDKSIHWISATGRAVYDNNGQPLVMLGVLIDISDRICAEQRLQQLNQELEARVEQRTAALRESEERWQLALRGSNDGIWDWNLKTNQVFFSTRWKEMRGFAENEMSSNIEECWGRIHPDDYQRFQTALADHFAQKTPFLSEEYRVQHKNGSYIWVLTRGQALWDTAGNVIRISGSATDITQRKQIEAALRESERRYATLAEASPVAIFRIEAAGNCVYINERWGEMTGRPTESGLGMGWLDAVHPEDRESILMKKSQSLLKPPTSIRSEGRHLLPDGSIKWFYCQLLAETNPDGSFIGYIGTLTDINTRKQIEEALWESERRYASLAEASPVAIFRLDAAGNCMYVNERWCKMSGRPPEEAMGWKWLEALHPEDRDRFIRNLSQLSQPERLRQDEGRHLRPDGSICWFYVQVLAETDSNGYIIGYVGTMTDITARKEAEIAQQKSDRRYATLAEAVPVGIFQFDIQGNCVYVNERWCEMTGRPTESALGMGYLDVLYPDDRDQLLMEWTQWTQVCQPGELYQKEGRYLRPDTSINWFSGYALPETNPDGRIIGYVGTITDITERKQTEEQLRKLSERLTLAMKSGGFGIWELDIVHDVLIWDEQMYELYGVQPSEFTGAYETWIQGVHPEDRAAADDLSKRVRRGELEYNTEFRVVHPNGSIRYIKAYALIEQNQQGEALRMVGVNHDITERKLGEQELILNRDLREAIYHESTDAIFLVDPQTLLTIDCNRRAVELFAANHKADLIGIAGHTLQRYQFSNNELAAIESEMQSKGFWSRELEYVTSQGKYFWGNIAAKPITVAGRNLNLVRVTDISDRKQSEEILATYTRELADLYNNAPCGYHSLDTDGRFVNINDTELQWLGYSYEEIIGQRFIDYVTEASRLVFLHNYPKFKNRGWIKDLEFDMVCKDGSILPILLNATAVKTEDGTYLCSRSSIFDIRDRKQTERELQESRTMLRLVLDTIPQRVFWKDCESRYVGCNPSFANDYQLTADEIIGKTDLELPWAEWAHLYRADDAFVINTRTAKLGYEEPTVNLDGKQIWLRTSKVPLTNSAGEIIGILGSHEDITHRKQAEEQLHHTNQQLARATRLKDEFLANMSHELRTPLNAILGMSEGFQEGVFGVVNERQIKAISTIERSGKHLLELINDILDLSKIESGKLELQLSDVPVRTLCDASISFIKQMALKKNIGLSTRITNNIGNIQVDDRRLRQVLINLLSNAIKFTPEGGSVRLEVSLEEARELGSRGAGGAGKDEGAGRVFSSSSPSSPHICFSVIDTGIGIHPEDINKLFQPFIQLDSSLNRQYSGTGLGLVLVQRIATLHGGTVCVRSEVGEGSCFTVRIPYQSSDYVPIMQVTAPSPSHRLPRDNASVLIIEDSVPAAEQITRYLTEMGMQPIVYPRGEGSIEQALRVQPALILLDLQLPNLSGWDVLNRLQTHPQTKDIPVIIISVVDERTKGLAQGAAEYIVKPINREQFHATLEKLQYPLCPDSPALIVVPEPHLGSPLILLAEDNQANIDTMSGYLESRGYRLVMAKNGQQAIEVARSQQPDLIIMDIQMPVMDGLEAMHCLRQEQQFAHVPIIALTALAMPGDRENCLDAGANEYLSKPIKLKQLAVKIQQLLGR
ncbi:MAG: PAS domain S-box protein [Aulosira sp. DedQUE10]|nr:PAS domain S-box protein [Aulosira sp. DedQUE10]